MTSVNTEKALLRASACPQQSVFKRCCLPSLRRQSRRLTVRHAESAKCSHAPGDFQLNIDTNFSSRLQRTWICTKGLLSAALTGSCSRRNPANPCLTKQLRSSSRAQRQQLSCFSSLPNASGYPMLTADLAEGLEAPVQLLYLATLLGFLAVGAYLVVRQVTLIAVSSSYM